jgi:hypothetical protein
VIEFKSPFRVKIKGVQVATLEAYGCMPPDGCNVYALTHTNLTGANEGLAELRLADSVALPQAVYKLRVRATCGCFSALVHVRNCTAAIGPGSTDNTTGGSTYLGTGGVIVPIPSCPE